VTTDNLTGGLAPEDDLFFPEPPDFEWVREGASFWLFEESGEFALPRIGIEAEPHSWESRRYAANLSFADGRVLHDVGRGAMANPLDSSGRPAILGAGPLSFRCIEHFRSWEVSFDGTVVDTDVSHQISQEVDRDRKIPLSYRFELSMVLPPSVQDTSPGQFFTMGKGQQRDALSVGLGWRFEQLFRGEGELIVGGERRTATVSGMRVKRRSVRTDGLFLRGHCWQTAVFPDGRAFGYLAYPPHEDGHAAWNDGFVYQDGQMYPAKAANPPWLRRIVARDDDVSVELESELGITRIEGKTALSTFRVANRDIWGLDLQQTGVRYEWDGQTAYGMLERSAPSSQTALG
jgi:hypothetical protein